MASSRSYLDFILDQLSGLEEISYRAMMGEYLIYYKKKLVAGIYDDRLMIKNTVSAGNYIENPALEPPYEGAKPMILVENVDNREHLEGLFRTMYDALPAPKTEKKH